MKPKHQRLVFIVISLLFLCIAVLLTLQAFRNNLVFFFSPSELAEKSLSPDQTIRIGGLVENGSILQESERITFRITDGNAHIAVSYQGVLPGLFREGQGVVAEGYLADPAHFHAKRVLTKHDENYMPKEVIDALKKNGQWREPGKQ